MNFSWEDIGKLIAGAAVSVTACAVLIGKGFAYFSKDLTNAKESRDTGKLYDRQKAEIIECKLEIKQLKKDHADCDRRLDEQEQLISRLNLRIIDLQNHHF